MNKVKDFANLNQWTKVWEATLMWRSPSNLKDSLFLFSSYILSFISTPIPYSSLAPFCLHLRLHSYFLKCAWPSLHSLWSFDFVPSVACQYPLPQKWLFFLFPLAKSGFQAPPIYPLFIQTREADFESISHISRNSKMWVKDLSFDLEEERAWDFRLRSRRDRPLQPRNWSSKLHTETRLPISVTSTESWLFRWLGKKKETENVEWLELLFGVKVIAMSSTPSQKESAFEKSDPPILAFDLASASSD